LRALWILCVALIALAAPARAAGPVAWFIIVAEDGDVVGHASERIVETPRGLQIIDEQVLKLRDRGAPPLRLVRRTVTTRDAAGGLQSIEIEGRQGRGRSLTTVRFEPGRAVISRQAGGDVRLEVVPLTPEVRFDDGRALLRAWNPAATPSISYLTLNIEALAVEQVVIEAVPGARPGADGRFPVLRRIYENGQLRAIARLTLDRDHRVAAITQPMFGTTVTIRPTDEATALGPYQPYPLLARTLTKSPFRIPGAAASGRIRYRFGFRDGIVFPFPVTADQRATPGDAAATVDVCQGCGPGLPTDPAYLADARRPTAWLQSDHPSLLAIARPIAGLKVSEARKMELLLDRGRRYLARMDFAGHFSALETIQRGAGDCTEAAVLLAALGRAAGIPTRIANGLVYSREQYHGVSNVFMPHSWTLAYVDGEWRSFDLALGDFDATHIALTISDGDARSVATASQLASLLQWQAMTQIKSRPTP